MSLQRLWWLWAHSDMDRANRCQCWGDSAVILHYAIVYLFVLIWQINSKSAKELAPIKRGTVPVKLISINASSKTRFVMFRNRNHHATSRKIDETYVIFTGIVMASKHGILVGCSVRSRLTWIGWPTFEQLSQANTIKTDLTVFTWGSQNTKLLNLRSLGICSSTEVFT